MRIGSYKVDGEAEPHDFILLDDDGEFIDEDVPQYILKFMWEQQEKIAQLFEPTPDEALREDVELAVLNFATDFHRYENFRKDIATKGIKSHPRFVDQILTKVRETYVLLDPDQSSPKYSNLSSGDEAQRILAQQDMVYDGWKKVL